MIADRFRDLVFGCVTFTASQGFREAFLNACRQEKAALLRVSVRADGIRAAVRWKDFPKVQRAAEASGMLIHSVCKRGLAAALRRYRFRLGIPVGLLCGALLFQFLSCVLWSVEVTGLETIDEAAFVSYLAENGVKKGAYLLRLDCRDIGRMIQAYSETVLNATVNLVGCKLYVAVYERTLPPPLETPGECANLVAAKQGEVLSVHIFAGEPAVKAGDTVEKGDMLVYGVDPLKNGGVRLLRARAQITARTNAVVSCTNAKRFSAQKIEKTKQRVSLYLFGLQIPPLRAQGASAAYLSTSVSVFPLGIVRAGETVFSEAAVVLTDRQAALLSLSDLAVAAVRNFNGKQIETVETAITYGAQVTADASFFCIEDIAAPQPVPPPAAAEDGA